MNARKIKPVARASRTLIPLGLGALIAFGMLLSAAGPLHGSTHAATSWSNPATSGSTWYGGGSVTTDRKKTPAQLCAASGGLWVRDANGNWGCANKFCFFGNNFYLPGETIQAGGQFYMCDGFTGAWFLVGRLIGPPPGNNPPPPNNGPPTQEGPPVLVEPTP